MKHTPTLLDVASDLRRCVMLEFTDPNFSIFWDKAQSNFNILKRIPDVRLHHYVQRELKKSENRSLEVSKRKEHILMAANFLQGIVLKLA